ncbi:S41 family peptidase [Chlorobium sp. N1]|nr:S41 family peptidase [Chlorobium sp. N1]
MGAPSSVAAASSGERYFDTVRSIDLFGEVTRQVAGNYVDTLDVGRMIYSGIDGMLETLDPYSVFLDAEESRDLGELTSSQYAGIGITIAALQGGVYVTSVEDGWPASKAGLRTGDRLSAVNGTSLDEKSLDEVRELIRGDVGTPVTLDVRRSGSEPFRRRIMREEVQLSTVEHAAFLKGAKGIGYIAMSSFADRSGADLRGALETLRSEAVRLGTPMRGVILDLRENPGGLLEAAVDVTSSFVEKGSPVVSIRGRSSAATQSYSTAKEPFDAGVPLAVLVNARSASAAEIVAGAVQDLDRGVIVGERSFGKGLVQSVIGLPYENSLKLTTAKYYTPSGRLIQKESGLAHGARDVLPRQKAGAGTEEVFRTSRKRKVYGGGGIQPDVAVSDPEPSAYLDALYRKGMLFLFAREWRSTHPAPPAAADSVAIASEFGVFLKAQEFLYRSAADRKLEELKKLLAEEEREEDAKTGAALVAMEREVDLARAGEMRAAAGEVAAALREELLLHYDEGRAFDEEIGRDPVVLKAAGILSSPRTYRRMLGR